MPRAFLSSASASLIRSPIAADFFGGRAGARIGFGRDDACSERLLAAPAKKIDRQIAHGPREDKRGDQSKAHPYALKGLQIRPEKP